MELDDLALSIESRLSPQQTTQLIERDFYRLNLHAENGAPYYVPFDLSDVPGEERLQPDAYLAKTPLLAAQLTGLELSRANLSGKRILNVGAGKTSLGAEINRLGGFCVDLDPGYGTIARPARSLAVKAVGDESPFGAGGFDEVILCHVLCVVDNPVSLIREAFRAIRPNGIIRIFPLVAFGDLRLVARPGLKVFRTGLDDFRVELCPAECQDIKRVIGFLTNQSLATVKPDRSFWQRRIEGYYYRSYPDDFWLGDKD